ncbi:MAG: alpha-amylase family glycosyl hydrolase [Opitutales bacterium]
MKPVSRQQMQKVRRRLKRLYGDEHDIERMQERLFRMVGRYGVGLQKTETIGPSKRWNESDSVLITYGDMIRKDGETTLRSLRDFCREHLKSSIKTVHILPFSPYSSDDGFSVIDYREVDPNLGGWEDVVSLGMDFQLMFDLVLNHCSAESTWFRDFCSGIAPARYYFLEMDPEMDLSDVVRPRSSPLLTKVLTRDGESHVWTTFSADQVDLNWQNPDVFFEFVDILFLYISMGCRIVRLDAVAFLWKVPGTACIHLPETHEMVKLLRDIVEMLAPHVLLLTETNVPHEENVSYFGNGDEAHMVYNFSLPPLVLHGLLNEDARLLTQWAHDLNAAPRGCTFFNFTASHDGIGMRPLQGLVEDADIDALAEQMKAKGGRVNYRSMPDGSQRPYELNITYFDALRMPGDDALSLARFLCSQALMLAFKGVPAVYFHSLVGTPNYQEGVERTQHNRTINRRKYARDELDAVLAVKDGLQARVFRRYQQMLRRRARHPAFHPDGPQVVHNGGKNLFILERTSPDGNESVMCLFNFTAKKQVIGGSRGTPLLGSASSAYDILSQKSVSFGTKGLSLEPFQAVWLTVPSKRAASNGKR